MKIYALDIETKGLNAKEFVYGTILGNDGYYYSTNDKTKLWENILHLAEKNHKQEMITYIYGHNIQYDFYGTVKLPNPYIKFICTNPFIVNYEVNGQILIKFLDTMSIFSCSLKDLGNIISYKKYEMPQELINKETFDMNDYERIRVYNKRDCEIVLKALDFLQSKLNTDDVYIKRLYTINQIAIQYILDRFKAYKLKDFFYIPERNMTYFNKYNDKMRIAYKGAICDAKPGKYANVTYIDKNSLYGYCAMQIPFPKLNTQRIIYNPLAAFKQEYLLNSPGISKAVIEKKKDSLGCLAIRTPDFIYFPYKKSLLCGIWTHIELVEAIKNDYEIKFIEWSILWQQADFNPYREAIPEIYEKRKLSAFDNWFYKSIINSNFGKFGQHKFQYELFIDDINKAKDYAKRNIEMFHGVDTTSHYIFYKDCNIKGERKPYYCLYIPIMINAYARIHMYREIKKIPYEDFLYTDTDSIIFKGNHLDKFTISDRIGDFKIKYQNESCTIWNRKSYRIGDEYHIAGVSKNLIDKDKFEEGTGERMQMITIKNFKDFNDIGTFKKDQLDYKQKMEDYKNVQSLLEEQKLFIDVDVKEIHNLLSYIKSYLNETN